MMSGRAINYEQASTYYEHYTGRNWEDARNYNICLDTSRMDYQTCVDIIKGFIDIKYNK